VCISLCRGRECFELLYPLDIILLKLIKTSIIKNSHDWSWPAFVDEQRITGSADHPVAQRRKDCSSGALPLAHRPAVVGSRVWSEVGEGRKRAMPSPREGGGRGEAETGMSGGRHPPRGGAPVAEGRRRPRRGGQRQSGRHPPRRRPLRQATQKEGGSSCSPPGRRELASASASGPPSSQGLAVEVEQLAVATKPPPPRAMEPCRRRI
jgi:hypothetical protein